MAMEKDELLRRIEKKEKDIEKINKRIAKWSKGLRPEDIAICKPYGDSVYGTKEYQTASTNYRQYLKDNEGQIPSSDDYNKGPNIDELHRAYIDLGEAQNTFKKYQDSLAKIDNFNNMEKIGPLWDFLTEWENKVFNWYLVNAEKYFDLKKNYENAWEENKHKYLGNYKDYYGRLDDYRALQAFKREYYSKINQLTQELVKFEYKTVYDNPNHKYEWDDHKRVLSSYTVDKDKLAKILADEKVKKYEDLVNRITSVVGVIQDAKGLSIGDKSGEINGFVIGDKGKANVETISAGGYAIQCFHYRILVHKIK